ncbi:tetratricopeptide repeat protein [Chromobacterium vaccinii]|uniref:tetratricopeptide repeat protein n=1 Tax=Chromobacterium vaccinii TaxID=1108595 RepID=UPI003C761160
MSAEDPRLSDAQRLHLAGELEAAESSYRALLVDGPAGAAARHWLGFLLLQQDRLAEARQLLAQAVADDGGHAEWHFNLGMACARLRRRDEAIAALRQASSLDPAGYFYWTNLAALLDEDGQRAPAEEACRRAIALDAGRPDAFHLLTGLLLREGRYDEARRSNAEGVLAEPPQRAAPVARAQALVELGRRTEARALAEDWLNGRPDHPAARHWLAAFAWGETPSACSVDYVGQTFDAAAADFDTTLGALHYRGPRLVADWLAAERIAPRSLLALDLGCGTGLIGAELRPFSSELIGVDLSAGMLEQARAKAVYDATVQSELHDFLAADERRYPLIACIDTLIYLGSLDRLFALLATRLAANGALLLSVERLADDDGGDYRLHHCGRYRHGRRYLAEALGRAGLRAAAWREIILREEAGCPVEGWFVCAQHNDDR